MTKIKCPCIECVHINAKGFCGAKNVSLGDHYVHTVRNGFQHYWSCNEYEKSEEMIKAVKSFENFLNACLGGKTFYDSTEE